MFTLRGFYDYAFDGTPKMAHVKNLSRDPHEALQKARDYIVSQGGDPDGFFASDVPVLADFDPNKVSDLNTWGECDPRRQHDLSLIAKGEMPFGKHSGQAIADIPIEYFANWYLDGDIDTKRSDTVVRSAFVYRFCLAVMSLWRLLRQTKPQKQHGKQSLKPSGQSQVTLVRLVIASISPQQFKFASK